ncbi:MAG: cellobiohydrolase A [Parcubacteria group bacterium Greene1014_15]|nr:MAG: cellobiohydrolase A [Parcubacteria group bacterium Greene1014_15]
MNNLLKIALLCVLFCVPIFAHAQIAISEIMYDLEGSDENREWIEIQNTSSLDIDVSLWWFFEEGRNHKLAAVQGNQILSPGDHAIIVQKLENFKADWPQYGGVIFDSSFLLKNTGETLVMRDTELKDIDAVSYTADQGGAGDGRTLQKVGGSWVAGMPTPGAANIASAAPVSAPPPSFSSPAPTPSPSSSGGNTAPSASPLVPKSIRVVIDTSATTMVGGRADFRGSAYGFENKPLENVRYIWNFGDGSVAEGEHVLHTYSFEGKYAVVLSVASGEFSATAHVTVEAIQALVRLSRILKNEESAYVVYNDLRETIDLSGWRIVSGETSFTLPQHSFVVSQGKAVFPVKTTGLSTDVTSFSLLYPNGALSVVGTEEQTVTAISVQVRTEDANLVVQTPVVKKEAAAMKSTAKKKALPKKTKDTVPLEIALATETARIVSTTEQAALGRVGGNAFPYTWLAALVALISLGAGAAVYLRRKGDDTITLID